jgi:ribosomal protein S18 acetylase RimI-like enzyme
MNIRPAEQRDRDRIHDILRATGRFTDEEVRCAMELVDEWLATPEKGDYICHVAENSSAAAGAVGYTCYGPTPLTDGVYDLYWIAVDPNYQGSGFGQGLLQFVENEVKQRRGRMLLIETSSKETYGPTLRFYERAGYEEVTRIKDFYRIADDKIVFCKRLES